MGDGSLLAIQGGTILTGTGETIEDGVILVGRGRIEAVCSRLDVPAGTATVDARGKFITPGFIDAHSHLGLFGEPEVWAARDGNEMTDPITPHLRGMDSFNPDDPSFRDALSAGVTAVYTTPGSANVVGGTGLMVKLVGQTVADMAVPGVEHMKMALGENPKRVYGEERKKAPSTRMGNAATLREALVKARNYLDKWERAARPGAGDGECPERDLRWETLGKVLRREMKARIHCHRADDILTAVRIAEEFNLDYVLEHVTEGYKVAEILAEKDVPCVVGPLLIGRHKMELRDIRLDNAPRLAAAGVRIALQCDALSETRWLPLHAGIAVREGMPVAQALAAITLNPARILGVAERLGSIEPGKDADLAIFDGHPFHTFTRCLQVFVNGQLVYEQGQK